MNTIAEFTIIGRVGEIKQVGSTLRVSVASSFSRRDNSGEWVERARWNEVTVFGEGTRGYVKRNIVKGDLIFTSGSMGETKWEKDGETFYGVTLACEQIERLSKGPNRASRCVARLEKEESHSEPCYNGFHESRRSQADVARRIPRMGRTAGVALRIRRRRAGCHDRRIGGPC